MPKKLKNRWYGYHTYFYLLFSLLLIGSLFYYNWLLGVISIIFLIGLIYFVYKSEINFRDDLNKYVETITYRVKKAGTDVLHQMPIGLILYNEEKKIEWHNPYLFEVVEEEQLIGRELSEVIPDFKWYEGISTLAINEKIYQLDLKPNERLIYLTDITEYTNLYNLYESEKLVFGIIHLDNLDEVGQGLDELSRSLLLTDVTSAINDWASDLDIYLRRYTADKFFIVTNMIVLEELESSRFDILDVVRDMTADNKIPLTLSIGIGAGVDSFLKLGALAQSSLDIALGRGGDQAAVKVGERLSFYGGKSNAVEKRTRVRARVISHALKDLIKESDLVLIMGHTVPDMDAIGSSIGILKAVLVNKKEGYIVLDESNPMIENLMDDIGKHKELPKYFLTPEKALNLLTTKTLLIMVDTHKPSLTIEPKLVENTERVVVIDHHRRGEEFVEDPVLVYIEPYASSTSELVTELLQYQSEKLEMDKLESTALLAGIFVDTKNFAYRTGARTFEAASFLRTNGADPAIVQKFLKEDIDDYVIKSELVRDSKIFFDNIRIARSEEKLDQILIAKTADTLLNMSGIKASFVISARNDGYIAISGRSFGEINVQVIMERLGGGGHLTNAAVQLENITLEEAEGKLVQVLQTIKEEGGFST